MRSTLEEALIYGCPYGGYRGMGKAGRERAKGWGFTVEGKEECLTIAKGSFAQDRIRVRMITCEERDQGFLLTRKQEQFTRHMCNVESRRKVDLAL